MYAPARMKEMSSLNNITLYKILTNFLLQNNKNIHMLLYEVEVAWYKEISKVKNITNCILRSKYNKV